MTKSKAFSQAKSGASAPSASTDGMVIAGCAGVMAVFSAPVGETFDGTGTMQCYVYLVVDLDADDKPATWRWARYSALDATPVSGQRDFATGSVPDEVGGVSRILWVPSGVGTSSSGTLITSVQSARF